MKTYPIRVPPKGYRGSNPSKLRKFQEYNRVARKVEDYINADLANKEDDTINQYMSSLVAIDLGEDSKLIHEIIFSVDCGHNGITIVKGDYERAMERLGKPSSGEGK